MLVVIMQVCSRQQDPGPQAAGLPERYLEHAQHVAQVHNVEGVIQVVAGNLPAGLLDQALGTTCTGPSSEQAKSSGPNWIC